MSQKSSVKKEVIMAGLGGKGVLIAGRLLAEAGGDRYRYVTWYPAYYGAQRGGPCECTIVFSDREISSPLLDQAEVVIVVEFSQLKSFEGRVDAGGTLIVEEAGMKEKVERDDIKTYTIPGVDTAIHLGDAQAANFVILGAYLGLTRLLPLEAVDREMEKKLKGGRGESLLTINKKALREGVKLIERC